MISTVSNAQLRIAGAEHISQIFELAQSYYLDNVMPKGANQFGFLVSGFSMDKYRDFLCRADHFYVVVQQNAVLAFLLAYSSDRIQADEWLNLRIREKHPGPFVLIKQVCVRRDMSGKGLASRLYQNLIARTAVPLFTVIVEDPPNLRSVSLHQKFGFTRVFSETPPGERPRGIWVKLYS